MRLLLALAFLAGFALPAAAAPSATPWPRWERHDDANAQIVDFRPWGRFLNAYLRPGADRINRVAYGAVTPGDREALEADLQRLQRVPISSYSRAEQRAYWTNLYNELTVAVVLRHYPVESITKIDLNPGLFSAAGPWNKTLLQVEGEALSLNDIEHRILRPIWRDPRTHYSVNCAALGCPNLQAVPYAAATMEAMLDKGAEAYVNSARGFHVDRGRLTASSIYGWYKADFGGTDQGVIEHLRRYARPGKRQTLDGVTEVAEHGYDWRLNDVVPG